MVNAPARARPREVLGFSLTFSGQRARVPEHVWLRKQLKGKSAAIEQNFLSNAQISEVQFK
jgi:hypothetical protein